MKTFTLMYKSHLLSRVNIFEDVSLEIEDTFLQSNYQKEKYNLVMYFLILQPKHLF